jgi:hypothetical protein
MKAVLMRVRIGVPLVGVVCDQNGGDYLVMAPFAF